jgi:hypothetical protein
VLDEHDPTQTVAATATVTPRSPGCGPAPGPWAIEAACVGLSTAAFVNPVGAAALAWGKKVCASCPVCGDYAATAHAFGVWSWQMWRAGKVPPRAS